MTTERRRIRNNSRSRWIDHPHSLLSENHAHPLLHTDHFSRATTQKFHPARRSRIRRRTDRVPLRDRPAGGARLRAPFDLHVDRICAERPAWMFSPGPEARRLDGTLTGRHRDSANGAATAAALPIGSSAPGVHPAAALSTRSRPARRQWSRSTTTCSCRSGPSRCWRPERPCSTAHRCKRGAAPGAS